MATVWAPGIWIDGNAAGSRWSQLPGAVRSLRVCHGTDMKEHRVLGADGGDATSPTDRAVTVVVTGVIQKDQTGTVLDSSNANSGARASG